jgi:hypothetical protein
MLLQPCFSSPAVNLFLLGLFSYHYYGNAVAETFYVVRLQLAALRLQLAAENANRIGPSRPLISILDEQFFIDLICYKVL